LRSDSDTNGTLPTYVAKCVATSLGVSHVVWLRRLLQVLKSPQFEPTEIQVENKSAIELAKNLVHHESTKHINVRFHSIQEDIKYNEVIKSGSCAKQ
jgi:hypothetical protein